MPENGPIGEISLLVYGGAMVVQVHDEQSQGDEDPEGCAGDHGVPTCRRALSLRAAWMVRPWFISILHRTSVLWPLSEMTRSEPSWARVEPKRDR
jgi:hypothetical protein